MKITKISCFSTSSENSGNIAGVVTEYKTVDKQALAHDLNLPVTVFISNDDSECPLLEFFYPNTEMPLCLHGTLAAATVISNHYHITDLTCKTTKDQILQISRRQNIFQIKVSAQNFNHTNIHIADVCKMLNMDASALDDNLPLKISSVGSPKLLVPIVSLKKLGALKPDFKFIREWSILQGVNGLYAYTKETYSKDANTHARGFNPKTGHNEDVATGVAAAALSLVLKKDLTIEQGFCLDRPSKIIVTYQHDNAIFVGGMTSIS